jgi:hypothetical protein
MSSDTSSTVAIDPTDEVDKEKSSGKPEDKKKTGQCRLTGCLPRDIPKVVGFGSGDAEIRTRRCKEHKA